MTDSRKTCVHAAFCYSCNGVHCDLSWMVQDFFLSFCCDMKIWNSPSNSGRERDRDRQRQREEEEGGGGGRRRTRIRRIRTRRMRKRCCCCCWWWWWWTGRRKRKKNNLFSRIQFRMIPEVTTTAGVTSQRTSNSAHPLRRPHSTERWSTVAGL